MTLSPEMKKELWRKLLHMGVLIVLPIATLSKGVLVLVIVGGAILYLVHESHVRGGGSVPLLSDLIQKAKRVSTQEIDHSPFMMGIGVITTLLIFPFKPAAAGLFQLAFADMIAAVVGMMWGKHKLRYSSKKSWEGTISYFVMAMILMSFFYSIPVAMLLALTGAVIESLPYKDWDNLLIPIGVAALASFF